DKVDMGLQISYMFSDEQGRLDELAQLAMSELGTSTIFKGVLVPQKARRVTSATYLHSVRKGVKGAGRIHHEIHFAAHSLPATMYCLYLALDRTVLPSMDFERRISHFQALLGELGVGVWRVQTALDEITMVGARVGGETLTIAAQ